MVEWSDMVEGTRQLATGHHNGGKPSGNLQADFCLSSRNQRCYGQTVTKIIPLAHIESEGVGLRFLCNSKSPRNQRIKGPLTTQEISKQRLFWEKKTQKQWEGSDQFKADQLRPAAKPKGGSRVPRKNPGKLSRLSP